MAAWWQSLFGPRFWIMAYAAMILGFVLPAGWLPESLLQAMVPVFLGGILFFSGLRFPLWEMCEAARSPRLYQQLFLLAPLKLAIIPLAAFVCLLPLLPSWAAGVYLVMLMPMGLSSIAFTDLYRGNRMLSIALVVGTSVLAPLTVPLMLMIVLGNEAGRLPWQPLLAQAFYIIALLMLPLLASQLVRGLFPRTVNRYHLSWNAWAICCSCLLVLASISGTQSLWQQAAWVSIGGAVLACTLATLISLVMMIPLWKLLSRANVTAFALGAIFMNNGLAVAFALRFYPEQMAMILPAVMMQVPMVAATTYVGWLATRPGSTASHQESPSLLVPVDRAKSDIE